MNYTPSSSDLREMITKELGIQGLSLDKQNTIINSVTESLLERVTLALMSRLPEAVVKELSAMPPDEKAEAMIKEAYAMSPENMQSVIQSTIREGIEKYKEFLAEESSQERS